MSKELTREHVLHVANLGRVSLTEEEITKFQFQLKQIWDEIEKINNVDIDETIDIMISPINHFNVYREDIVGEMLNIKDTLKNVPKSSGNYIEVPKVLND
ncbi:MAG: Asp-tRNA(Asn)/Glu-tRNA(Gln) amidotransferase subunit GatC [Bacilli bacterium]|nr:Asp-tRNA(Asn)/Glu-tRNA(Gln) amidotransferase subunit GatC [Bacilli bacterium]